MKSTRFTIGFTGTREEMTEIQYRTVLGLVLSSHIHYETYIRGAHGDCLGADVQFHEICAYVGIPIIIRPPIIDSWRAWLGTEKAVRTEEEFDGLPEIEKIYDPDDPFCRNRRIISDSGVVIAAPRAGYSVEPGMTWQTIRQIRRMRPQTPVFIVSPAGEVLVEQWTFLDRNHEWWEMLDDIEVTFDENHR